MFPVLFHYTLLHFLSLCGFPPELIVVWGSVRLHQIHRLSNWMNTTGRKSRVLHHISVVWLEEVDLGYLDRHGSVIVLWGPPGWNQHVQTTAALFSFLVHFEGHSLCPEMLHRHLRRPSWDGDKQKHPSLQKMTQNICFLWNDKELWLQSFERRSLTTNEPTCQSTSQN